ncbi:hypothetical protein FYZ36_11820 [Mobiluncus mulieris]|nr:hypothetical protein [Mobiluncus mulieris]MCV0014962.1 hypothetical protein [Mobiluncus mulieris]
MPAAVAGLAIAVAVGDPQSREKLKPCDLHKPKTHQIKSTRFFWGKTGLITELCVLFLGFWLV